MSKTTEMFQNVKTELTHAPLIAIRMLANGAGVFCPLASFYDAQHPVTSLLPAALFAATTMRESYKANKQLLGTGAPISSPDAEDTEKLVTAGEIAAAGVAAGSLAAGQELGAMAGGLATLAFTYWDFARAPSKTNGPNL